MEPKFAIVTLEKSTYVFLDGKCINDGLKNVKFSARDENGALEPTAELTVAVDRFSAQGITLEQFFRGIEDLKRQMAQAQEQTPEAAPIEEKE